MLGISNGRNGFDPQCDPQCWVGMRGGEVSRDHVGDAAEVHVAQVSVEVHRCGLASMTHHLRDRRIGREYGDSGRGEGASPAMWLACE